MMAVFDQIQQNSLELAKAIKVLEASTAALKCPTEEPPSSAAATSRTSLQCSSGYGTMNSTPAGSEDTIASGGKKFCQQEHFAPLSHH